MHPRPCFASVQVLRGLAALLVVAFHLQIIEGKYGHGVAVLPRFTRFADAGVDLFFVISGFVMATIAVGSYDSIASAKRFLVRRVWRIMPPYWFYTTLVVVLMAVSPGIANSSYQNQSILASYMLWPQAQLPVLTVGWTLIHEMYFYLMMAAMIALCREKFVPGILLAWAGLVLSAQLAPYPDVPWMAVVSNAMTLEFIAGALVGIYWRQLPGFLARPCFAFGALAFVLMMPTLESAGVQAVGPGMRTLLFGTSATLVVLGAVLSEKHGRLRTPDWLSAIGDSSYSLYLSHVFVISAMGRAWSISGLNQSWWQHTLFLLVAAGTCVLVAVLAHALLERPLLRLGRRMSGRGKTPIGVQPNQVH